MKQVGLFIILFLLSTLVWSQRNLHTKNISTQSDTIFFDTLSVDPHSVVISDVGDSAYAINYAQGYLLWYTPPPTDSVEITYRTWAVNITDEVSHKSTSVFKPIQGGGVNPFTYNGNKKRDVAFTSNKLNKTGSISRGVLFGNNQNLGLNSNLNLQLAGNLSKNIKIKAVISDDNIPIQPEGNTQVIQDFDQIYINLYSDDWGVTAGDYRIKNPNSYFMAYDKRLRGGKINTRFTTDKNVEHDFSVSGAISRGKFSRNVIQGVEGNQGPYRVVGAENESYIIVLSGTEKVYIDGVLMSRGQENDYIIDYNNAEVVFTANQPINKDKRIVVEFQYSAQAYNRSLIQLSDQVSAGKLNLNFNVYTEQDAKNQSLLQDLSPSDINLLSSIGDQVDQAVVPSAYEVEYSNSRVLYKAVILPGMSDSIYVYSTSADSARYQVSFSDVGQGNGDYTQINSSANGVVHQYITPVNGIHQADTCLKRFLLPLKNDKCIPWAGIIT